MCYRAVDEGKRSRNLAEKRIIRVNVLFSVHIFTEGPHAPILELGYILWRRVIRCEGVGRNRTLVSRVTALFVLDTKRACVSVRDPNRVLCGITKNFAPNSLKSQ